MVVHILVVNHLFPDKKQFFYSSAKLWLKGRHNVVHQSVMPSVCLSESHYHDKLRRDRAKITKLGVQVQVPLVEDLLCDCMWVTDPTKTTRGDLLQHFFYYKVSLSNKNQPLSNDQWTLPCISMHKNTGQCPKYPSAIGEVGFAVYMMKFMKLTSVTLKVTHIQSKVGFP